MMKKINRLFAKMQQAAQIVAALATVIATLIGAIIALYGLGFTITWAAMFFENTAALHAPATFNGHPIFTCILAGQPTETMALWTLPIKLQGLIIVFLGATSFYVASYAADWLLIFKRIYPFSKDNPNNHGIALQNKWSHLFNAAKAWWETIINALRKVALYVMLTMSTTGIVYIVWHILSAKCPM